MNIFSLISGKLSIGDALEFLEKHVDKIDGVLDLALNKHYTRFKKIFSKLKPTTIDRMILMLQELKKQ